jgi:hypothetical protein
MLHAGFVKFSLRNYFNHNQKELSMLHFLNNSMRAGNDEKGRKSGEERK